MQRPVPVVITGAAVWLGVQGMGGIPVGAVRIVLTGDFAFSQPE